MTDAGEEHVRPDRLPAACAALTRKPRRLQPERMAAMLTHHGPDDGIEPCLRRQSAKPTGYMTHA